MSVRARLALSYAGFLMLAGVLLLAVVWLFLLRYVPPEAAWASQGFFPGRDDLVRAFLPNAVMALAALLVFGLFGGWVLAGRMLAPLTRITTATRRVGAGDLSTRIRLEGSANEFSELADSFDGMVERLEAHVEEQRRFAANASHELRTPLAITRAMLEVAGKDPSRAEDALLDRLAEVNARAIELTEALLVLSRSGQPGFEREPVDLSLLAEDAVETLLPLAERQGVSLTTEGDVAHASGSGALLMQLTTNLVHNAIVHNLTEGGEVLVRTRVLPGVVSLTVENTGERVDPAIVHTLSEPFQRGTERVRADQAGAGLGLAIVRRIAEVHDGELELRAREGGGLIATVRFPAVPFTAGPAT